MASTPEVASAPNKAFTSKPAPIELRGETKRRRRFAPATIAQGAEVMPCLNLSTQNDRSAIALKIISVPVA